MALPARGRGADSSSIRWSTELQNCRVVEAHWNDAPQRVRVPYTKPEQSPIVTPSSAGTVKVGVNLRGPPRKAEYDHVTDSARVP